MESTRCHRDVFKQQCPSAFSGMDPSRCLSDVMGGISLLDYDALKGIDWEWQAMDGAMTKAPLGEEKLGPNPPDRAKRGVPIGLAVEGANRNDFKMGRATLESIPIDRPKPTPEE